MKSKEIGFLFDVSQKKSRKEVGPGSHAHPWVHHYDVGNSGLWLKLGFLPISEWWGWGKYGFVTGSEEEVYWGKSSNYQLREREHDHLN